MNKLIATSRHGSLVSDWPSGIERHEGELTPEVLKIDGVSHPSHFGWEVDEKKEGGEMGWGETIHWI